MQIYEEETIKGRPPPQIPHPGFYFITFPELLFLCASRDAVSKINSVPLRVRRQKNLHLKKKKKKTGRIRRSPGGDLRCNGASPWSDAAWVARRSPPLLYWQFSCVENILRGINGGHKLRYGYLNTLNSNWPRSDKDAPPPPPRGRLHGHRLKIETIDSWLCLMESPPPPFINI